MIKEPADCLHAQKEEVWFGNHRTICTIHLEMYFLATNAREYLENRMRYTTKLKGEK